ncbi:enoyl-CoA hydratase/isomerase family protein [Saccharopolyspora phatthalungensis]|uniref:Enoyl-CoA hydratase/carnithine racemase n=1 Tax=Saccharopolyspora phatthalungensis TaxID=664693 RepID=A0A840Q846_9PSEU|nr:enoyl-CoA hydratase/isomerase family protein [Saccharopolyspora phatthalungensis]MBB5158692.1 enoyl-CoA hydratase/carnithine racemase [Saccharopolyspora phatthalungensis]
MIELVAERTDRALVLTLNRPAKRNALAESIVEDLIECLRDAHQEPTDLVVLRGEGKTFSAGFDFGGLAEASDGDLLRRFVRVEQLLQLVFHAPFETLALAHGRVFGAAADLVCACTHRVGTPDSAFRFPGLAFGIVLGTRRLAGRIGETAARDVQGRGLTMDADHALRTGLLTEVADTSEWDELLARVAEGAGRVEADARSVFHRALAADSADADLADLVRSASVPGLRDRLQRFREEQKQ